MGKRLLYATGRGLLLWAAVSLAGCSLVHPALIDSTHREQVKQDVSDVVVDQWETVMPHLEEELSIGSRGGNGQILPEDVVPGLLQEERGEEYLEFAYSAAVTGDVDDVLKRARKLLPEEAYEDLLSEAAAVEQEMSRLLETGSRELKEEYREDFMRDVQQLTARSVVLLTAAVVYAFMPNFMIFGKISAAAAISVAAGAVAVTVLSIWRYYEFGGEVMDSFNQWLKDVTTEPKASYALATSVVAIATSMELNPVSTGIILAVFAVYQALDILRTMIEVYEL